MEETFETLETADIDMHPSKSIIEPIVNSNFGNILKHQNGKNQHQRTHKKTVRSTNIETLDKITSTETLVNSINKEILVNSINPCPSKYPGHHQYHIWKKTVLDVNATTKG